MASLTKSSRATPPAPVIGVLLGVTMTADCFSCCCQRILSNSSCCLEGKVARIILALAAALRMSLVAGRLKLGNGLRGATTGTPTAGPLGGRQCPGLCMSGRPTTSCRWKGACLFSSRGSSKVRSCTVTRAGSEGMDSPS